MKESDNAMSKDIELCISAKTGRFRTGVIFAVFALWICILNDILKAGIVFTILFLMISIVNISGEIRKLCWKIIYITVLLCTAAFLTIFLSQFLLNESAIIVGLLRMSLGMAICVIIYLVIYFFTLHVRTSVAVGSCAILLLTMANYYVRLFRGSELHPSDILSIGTAANVMAGYKIVLNHNIIYAWFLMILLGFVLNTLPECRVKQKFLARSIIFVSGCAIIGWFYISSQSIQALHFLEDGSVKNGYLLNFTLQIRENKMFEPDSYSVDTMKDLEDNYVATIHEKDTPDIFVIMDESFADLSVLGSELRTNEEVTPFIDSLTENTIKGYTLSSVYGGGTPNSEYEFLTGNSLFFFPAGSIVYQQYIKRPVYSVVSNLKDAGYKCISLHPYISSGWIRKTVYPYFGFDESFFLDDFSQRNLIRDYVSDQEMFEEMIRRYEEYKEVGEENIFMFGVTMQNHGAYTYNGDNFQKTISLEGYSGKYPDVERYLSLIHETDRAIEWLLNYLKESEKEAVVVFYGDHLPNLNSQFYEEVHGGSLDSLDDQNLKYTVPFFVWTNYDSAEQYVELTSLNYLSNLMYEAAGMDLPPYNQFLQDMMEEIPAINSVGFYSRQNNCFLAYEDADGREKDVIELYEQFVYNNAIDYRNRNEFFFHLTLDFD